MRWLLIIFLVGLGSLTRADIVVPLKTLRSNSIILPEDLAIKSGSVPGTVSDPSQAIGLETRVVLYAGRPIRIDDLVQPAIVKRNQLVPLVFSTSGLSISTTGRALDRGAEGDLIRVMNIASRATLFGIVLSDGRIEIQSN